MRKITKQQQQRIAKQLEAWLAENGQRLPSGWTQLDTIGGTFNAIVEHVGEAKADFWLFGNFADPAHAVAAGINCNPYSGKWNLFINRLDIEDYGLSFAVEVALIDPVRKILATNPAKRRAELKQAAAQAAIEKDAVLA